MKRWLPVRFPTEPDKAIVYPDPFEYVRVGMELEHPTIEIIDGASTGSNRAHQSHTNIQATSNTTEAL